MVIAFGTLDKFQVQHIKFFTVGFCYFFQVIPFEKLFPKVPDLGEIVKIQCHPIIKKKTVAVFHYSGKRSVKFITLQGIYKLFHICGGG